MIISGLLLPVKGGPTAAAPAPTGTLNVGDLLTGRVTQIDSAGRGVVRFPDGSGFSFVRSPALTLGEPVQVEVLRLSPELAFRLVASSSQTAAQLAVSAEQSLVRAPDIFANLLRWSGLAEGNLALLQNSLPTISVQGLLAGELSDLVQLLETGSRQDVRTMIQQLRHGEVELLLAEREGGGPSSAGSDAAQDANAVRNMLHRLGDLLAMQEILPRTTFSLDGNQLLGYRLFWLMEGGMGEAIWYKKRRREEQEADAEQPAREVTLTTILLSLNMTNLGAIQARLMYADDRCSVRIAAEEEGALTALRRRIGELRIALLAAELPLHGLDLTRLLPGELKEQRMQALGMASRFSVEA
ncbi:MAG: flagellar hook-length control protein FliK [Magnetococcales bacterium]|nr:flagellar hook-length control protein FliK [Magnetococcales bacterium]